MQSNMRCYFIKRYWSDTTRYQLLWNWPAQKCTWVKQIFHSGRVILKVINWGCNTSVTLFKCANHRGYSPGNSGVNSDLRSKESKKARGYCGWLCLRLQMNVFLKFDFQMLDRMTYNQFKVFVRIKLDAAQGVPWFLQHKQKHLERI